MSAFDTTIKTVTRPNGLANDRKLPPLGSLNYRSIAAPTALAGTNGVETFLVTGNRDGRIKGSESTRITQNRSHTIGGNQSKQVAGNRTDNVAGNHLHTVMGDTHRTIIGNTNDTYAGTQSVEYKESQRLHEPVAHMHFIADFFEKHGWHKEEYDYFSSFINWAVSAIYMLNAEFRTAHAELKVAKAEAFGIGLTTHGHEFKLGEEKQETHVIHNHINIIQPVIAVAMVHEVVVTQKIFILGMNQVI